MATPKIDGLNVLRESYDPASRSLKTQALGTLAPAQFDRIELAYDGANVTGVSYSLDGSPVRLLTLEYDVANVTGISITNL